MEKFLRDWRQDAFNKHQYDSAIFIGDKLLALTNNDQDAFWLAQVHFSTGNYTRAQSFLARQDLIANNPSCRYLAGHCHIKQGRFEDALAVLGDKNPVHLISTPGGSRRKLQHVDGSLQNGHSKRGKGHMGERVDRSEERDREDAANIKFEAAICYLRGVCYAKQNAFDRAKECYKDAVRIDVQCFEAFDQLMKNSLMSPEEEWTFLASLNFDTISVGGGTDSSAAQEAAEFTKMLYTTRLSKYEHPEQLKSATETLTSHYHLSSNADILLSKAELLFVQCRFADALSLTSSILESDRYNFGVMPVHLACLYELSEKNALFLLSHDLADTHPGEPTSWLAVGIYYLAISRIAEARRYFSKASMMDPHFGPAWIGFAHTFAAEGEHDQAISAYSTAARLFPGTHLPPLFLGMQNLHLNNLPLAKEHLNTAYDFCKTDPLLLNELGVVFYHQDLLEEAVRTFGLALSIARDLASAISTDDDDAILPSTAPTKSIANGNNNASHASEQQQQQPHPSFSSDIVPPSSFSSTVSSSTSPISPHPPRLLPPTYVPLLANLAHAHRRLHDLDTALALFDEVLRHTAGCSAPTFAARALVLLELGRRWEAVAALHEALRRSPQDPVAEDLLARAMEGMERGEPCGEKEGREAEGVESALDVRMSEELGRAREREERGGGRRKGVGRRVVVVEERVRSGEGMEID
ncbi:MAG: anaphase promoting complex subunit cdc16 [Bathelium mastoideum]|nr:MAG: anaphase promoting complex subunit cdc16 [Bathelium mastoideum]